MGVRSRRVLCTVMAGFMLAAILASCTFSNDIPLNANPDVAAFALKHNISYAAYPESLIDLLERNPETKDFVLNYPLLSQEIQTIDLAQYANSESVPLFLQWDTRWGYLPYGSDMAAITGCGPVCLSMAAFYLTGDEQFSPDNMIAFAADNGYYSPGNGSSWTLISEGGEKLGFQVTELPLDKDRIFKSLSSGEPVICVVGPGDFTSSGHFLVMTGIENGMLRINDPNSIENSSKLWDYEQIKGQIKNLWSIKIK